MSRIKTKFVEDNAISNAKLAQVATQTIKGRTTAGTGNSEDLTATQATAVMNAFTGDSGSGGLKGMVPAPAAGDAAANKYLKADGTFAVPVINYIKNPGAEVDTSGWSAYADAAGTSPVDGAGGSPNVTITRTTSTPLRGSGSFLITKDAANRQGQGVSFDFSIDEVDKASMLEVGFDYVAGTNFVAGDSSDITAWVYDVTNSILIQLTPYTIQTAAGFNGHFKARFQSASNSSSYRLILHVGTTNASAWTFKYDNVFAGPVVSYVVSPVSDWTSFSMTIGSTGSAPTKGTTSTDEARWRRVGDSMEIHYDLQQTGAGSSGSGTYLYPIPMSLQIDTAKLTPSTAGAAVVGNATCGGGSLADNEGSAVAYNSTNIALLTGNDSNAMAFVGSSRCGLADSSTMRHSFRVVVPILGWSSNTVLSKDAAVNTVAMSSTTATGTISNGAFANVTFGTTITDTHAAFTGTTYTIPVTGYYNLNAVFNVNPSGNNSGTFFGQITKNGSVVGATSYNPITIGGQIYNTTVEVNAIKCSAGDTITAQAKENSGTTVAIITAAFSVARMPNPETIVPTAIISAWVPYTPTFTGFGTVSSINIVSRRVGDSLEIQGTFVAGTVTNVQSRMTLGFNGVDSNVTSDNSGKVATTRIAGSWTGDFNGGIGFTLSGTNLGYLRFSSVSASQAGSAPINTTTTIPNGATMLVTATVPINGWTV